MKVNTKIKLSALALAVAICLGAGGQGIPAASAADAAHTVSKVAIKQLQDAQKAIQAKQFDVGLAKLTEADAIAGKTPYDEFVIAQLRAQAYSQQGKTTEALPSYVAQVDSGFLAQEDSDRLLRGITVLYYQIKDYPKAVEYGQRSIASGKADADTYFIVGYSQFQQGKVAEAAAIAKDYLADAAKKGQKPTENSLILLTQAESKLKDNKAFLDALEQMVANYPKQTYWHDLLVSLRDANQRGSNSDIVTFNIYRLMRETDSMMETNDFLEMAQLATQLGSPGEAVDAIKRGEAAGAFKTDSEKSAAKSQLQTAQKLADTDRATLAKFEAEAQAAKGGEGDVRTGQAYLSYDQPDKALPAIQRGIAKGGLRNADEAQILLGITLLRLGRKDEAAAAFAAAKGTDQRLGGLARLWGYVARS